MPLVFSRDGKRAAIRSSDSKLRVWNVAGAVAEELAEWPIVPPNGLLFSPDGQKLLAWSASGEFQLFDIGKPAAPPLVGRPVGMVEAAAAWAWSFSQDGKTLAALTGKEHKAHSVLFWDVTGPQPKALPPRQLDPEKEEFPHLATRLIAGADGRFRLLGPYGGAIRSLDVSAPPGSALPQALLQTVDTWDSVAVEGPIVAAMAWGGRLLVFDHTTHEILLDSQLPSRPCARLQLTANGRGLAVVHGNGVVYLLRLPVPGKATPRRLDPDWLKRVQALKGDEQLAALTQELVHRNPWYDGKATPGYLETKIVSLKLVTDELSDLTPLRALPHLNALTVRGSALGKGRLRDLSVLKDVPLETLTADLPDAELRAAARAIKTLQTINGKDAAEFRRD